MREAKLWFRPFFPWQSKRHLLVLLAPKHERSLFLRVPTMACNHYPSTPAYCNVGGGGGEILETLLVNSGISKLRWGEFLDEGSQVVVSPLVSIPGQVPFIDLIHNETHERSLFLRAPNQYLTKQVFMLAR